MSIMIEEYRKKSVSEMNEMLYEELSKSNNIENLEILLQLRDEKSFDETGHLYIAQCDEDVELILKASYKENYYKEDWVSN